MVALAVKVTEVPAHIVAADAEIFTLTGWFAFTTIVNPELVIVVGEAHVALEISSTLITSPLVSVFVVYVVLLAPTLEPFSFH